MNKTIQFFTASLVFFNMATLTKHRILRCETYFFNFLCFVFFSKQRRKNCPKMQRASLDTKIPTERSPGTRFGSQNDPELTPERPKDVKKVEKCRFWTEPFFEH